MSSIRGMLTTTATFTIDSRQRIHPSHPHTRLEVKNTHTCS